jgi:hypothetical protein
VERNWILNKREILEELSKDHYPDDAEVVFLNPHVTYSDLIIVNAVGKIRTDHLDTNYVRVYDKIKSNDIILLSDI